MDSNIVQNSLILKVEKYEAIKSAKSPKKAISPKKL